MTKFGNCLIFGVAALVMVSGGCAGGSAVNSNVNVRSNAATNTNVNAEIKLDPANMPPGISMSPVPMSANAPGINAKATPLPKGATPTPGIPSQEQLKKPFKPGATPTPGIPSPDEIKRMMANPSNINSTRPSGEVPMMKSTRKTPTPGKTP